MTAVYEPRCKGYITGISMLVPHRVPTSPGVNLQGVLQPSIEHETNLRQMWAGDRLNPMLQNPLVGLLSVFDAPAAIRTTRARVFSNSDYNSKYVMPLSTSVRREEGEASMVQDLEEFKANWAVFTENSLLHFSAQHWDNVVAAGGSVLACLTPTIVKGNWEKRKYFHYIGFPSSDVDLFLWGMDSEQAEKKIVDIYEAVRESVPYEITCVRTKHTVSIHSQFPIRTIQIVLRLYSSPAEILAGFDVDAPCCAYDGTQVLANPRAVIAMMRQANTVDMTRRSPSYEVRLAKYAERGFEVFVPTLDRHDIDPTIQELSFMQVNGLACLLVLEQIQNQPQSLNVFRFLRRKFRGLEMDGEEIEVDGYGPSTLYIPYGPQWNAKKVATVIRRTDQMLNSKFNPKNKDQRLHRHPAFFAHTVRGCMENGCQCCPIPVDPAESMVQEDNDKKYVRGRITFIKEDPGRQLSSASFNPVSQKEWSAQVYLSNNTELTKAIIAGDRKRVLGILASETGVQPTNGDTLNRRDHLGRTPLITAVLARQSDISFDLINAGAKINVRMADGRTVLHCAIKTGLDLVVERILANNAGAEGPDCDNTDVLEASEWDLGLNTLAYATLFSSISVIDTLMAAGADARNLPLDALIKCRARMDGNSRVARKIAEKFGLEFTY